ncbi:MAG: M67 family metallopeptidase [Clostridiales bacterium]|jgi:proteasome lid subunit RPN8/RPN11|nr:M67 family metallopeptidase [Clostridiales bacterium]
MIIISRRDFDSISLHASQSLPNEACGLIAGTYENGMKIIRKVYLLENKDLSPEHFSIEPRRQLACIKDMRTLNLSPLGNFHSHPSTPARPSEEDIRLALDPKASYLIMSLMEDEPVLKSFSIANGQAVQEELEISESEKGL